MSQRIVHFLTIFFLSSGAFAQQAKIETCDCDFKIDPEVLKIVPDNAKKNYTSGPNLPDSSFQKQCGYLLVPENRKKKNSRLIKLPFIVVKTKNPDKHHDPVLYTAGGPGGSSLGAAAGLSKSPFIEHRDCIVFEQRGTRFALPYLRTFELDKALKDAVRRNLDKDSMTVVGVKNYKAALEKRGIDLSGYNTDETVSDIHDLLKALKIDSVNLFGVSYSGGLMTAVLQRDPSRIRSLILDSPLPTFVPIDEDEPVNFMEALHIYFEKVAADSVQRKLYGNLRSRFHTYFNAIATKTFDLPYLEAGTKDSVHIKYTKNELLAVVLDKLYDDSGRKDLARIVTDIMEGKHQPYMLHYFNEFFRRNGAPDGMRLSVYCADQTAYHSEKVRRDLDRVYPYLAGFHINDVYRAMCDCWKVPPVNRETKQPYYSDKPALLADGEMDPACRPLYIDRISHYMPNSQRFLLIDKGHGVIGKSMGPIVRSFLADPYGKIASADESIIGY
ncbi:alpha/beta hydrolase fold [Dyadobacter sp. SG02]|uniref:alpha/beta fold hydrolase n=1 Tax=Dyadobacter sp. SG02 TaxID=1855291 RepID=UPI0008ACF59C|nr:alpha/beta fold hydrolase [Dyadobacter sp. SG02]SEJ59834.1 alpha/beta hydrolase fold [Dyadobacter sp. SG02]